MTITAVINGQSVGTGSNIGDGKFSISPTTLQAGTTAYVVSVKLVCAAAEDKTQQLRVWYTTNYESVTSSNAKSYLQQTARYVDIMPNRDGAFAFTSKKDSSLEPVTGGYFNCWVDMPKLSAAATLTVNLVELP